MMTNDLVTPMNFTRELQKSVDYLPYQPSSFNTGHLCAALEPLLCSNARGVVPHGKKDVNRCGPPRGNSGSYC